MENKTICWYPFLGAAINTDGSINPCCAYRVPDKNERNYVWENNLRDNDHWKNLRQQMLDGERVSGCVKCYQDEYHGKPSVRQKIMEKRSGVPTENKLYPLEILEVIFSNLCNLACVSCDANLSTKWGTENIKAGRVTKYNVQSNSQFNIDDWDLSNLNLLIIIGGEPLMEQKRFIELMRRVNLPKCQLRVITNGTHLPSSELKALIESSKYASFMVSMDGLGGTNEWYRWPSKFDQVLDTLDTYNKWWGNNPNIGLKIHSVVNAFSVVGLEDFIKFFEEKYPNWMLDFSWVTGKEWQSVEVLPNSVKQKLIERFQTAQLPKQMQFGVNPYPYSISKLQQEPKPNTSWQDTKHRIMAISAERNLDFLEMVPKFKEFWDLEG